MNVIAYVHASLKNCCVVFATVSVIFAIFVSLVCLSLQIYLHTTAESIKTCVKTWQQNKRKLYMVKINPFTHFAVLWTPLTIALTAAYSFRRARRVFHKIHKIIELTSITFNAENTAKWFYILKLIFKHSWHITDIISAIRCKFIT